MLEDEYVRLKRNVADLTLNKHIMSFDVSVKPGEVQNGVIGFGFVHICAQLTIEIKFTIKFLKLTINLF